MIHHLTQSLCLQAELEKYQLENGHCLVPHDHPVGPWVGRQRSDRTEMSQDRIDKLDRIGFIWDAKENKCDNHHVSIALFGISL